MSRERHAAVTALFLEAREARPGDRPGLLARRCGADVALRRAVEDLLALDALPDADLDRPLLGDGFAVPDPHSVCIVEGVDLSGEHLGGYRLLARVAEGGMGAVYAAEQARPRRRVALKLLRAPDAARSVVDRFAAEAEFLGRLQHPGIAQVFEAGSAPIRGGRPQPFLAMEWIDGLPLCDHARRRVTGVDERVRLLVAVGDAVCHAHDRGVLHCDLKPSNILVDRTGRPRIIDFGIAALVRGEASYVAPAGTPAFLAPELLNGRPPSPCSDVYALGMVAGELLAGPPRSASRRRRRELDAVLAMSTARDPDRRYPSCHAFVADLRRYLVDEPVAAVGCGPLRRLVGRWRRRRSRLVAGALVIGLLAVTLLALGSARRHRDTVDRVSDYLLAALASASPAQLGDGAPLVAVLDRIERDVDGLAAHDPAVAVSLRAKVAWLAQRRGDLDRAHAAAVAALAAGRETLGPDHHATLEAGLVAAFVALERGDLEAAERDLREVFARAPDEALRGRSSLALGKVLEEWGRFAEARELFGEVAAGARDEPGSASWTSCSLDASARLLALVENGDGDRARVIAAFRRSHALYRRVFGEDAPETLDLHDRLGIVLCHDPGTRAEGLQLLEAGLARRRAAYGEDHPDTLRALHDLAIGRNVAGETTAALELDREAWRRRSTVLGPDHPQTLVSLNNFARLCGATGDGDRAIALFDELLRRTRHALPESHRYRGVFAANYGRLLLQRADLTGAESLLTEAVAALTRCLEGADVARIRFPLVGARVNLAIAKRRQGRLAAACEMLEELHRELERDLGPDHSDTAGSAHHLAESWFAAGREDDAVDLQRGELERRSRRLGPTHRDTLQSLLSVTRMLRARGAVAEAGRRLQRTVRAFEAAGSEPPPLLRLHLALCHSEAGDIAHARALLDRVETSLADAPLADPLRDDLVAARADVHLAAGEWAAAAKAYRESIHRVIAQLGSTNDHVARMRNNLAGCLDQLGEHAAAEAEWRDVLALRRQLFGEDHFLTLITASNAARNLLALGRPELALQAFEEVVDRAERAHPDRVADLLKFRANCAGALAALGRDADALALLERGLHELRASVGGTEGAPPPILAQHRELCLRLGRDRERSLGSARGEPARMAR